MTAGRYTELFFLDEATGLAAGHRPCAEVSVRPAPFSPAWHQSKRIGAVWRSSAGMSMPGRSLTGLGPTAAPSSSHGSRNQAEVQRRDSTSPR
jgi:hypothetical protein